MEHLLFHPVGFIAALALIEGNKELSFNPAVLIASLVCFRTGGFSRLPGDFSRASSAAYAAYVGHQRYFGHLADRLAS